MQNGHAQPSAVGRVGVHKITSAEEGALMPRVKFLKDTRHPDYGEVKKDEILLVTRDYVRDYAVLGIAEETDEPVTNREQVKP